MKTSPLSCGFYEKCSEYPVWELDKKITDRILVMNPVDRLTQEGTHRQDGDFIALPGLFFQGNGICHQQRLQAGIADPFDGRTGQDGMRTAGMHFLGSDLFEDLRITREDFWGLNTTDLIEIADRYRTRNHRLLAAYIRRRMKNGSDN